MSAAQVHLRANLQRPTAEVIIRLFEYPVSAERVAMSSYAKQKFFEAMYSLVGDGSIEMRLTYAANELSSIQAKNLPESMRIDFTGLIRELTSKPLSNDAGFIPRAVDRDECNRLAQKILSMYAELLSGL